MPKCNGCKIDHPSQWQHSCIDPAGHLVSTLYGIASASLDEGRLKAIFAEAAKYFGTIDRSTLKVPYTNI